MIDVFFRRVMPDGFCRVVVTTTPDSDRAQALIEVLCCTDKSIEAPSAGGRPSRRRGSIAQLVARRDALLDRELEKRAKEKQAAAASSNLLVYRRLVATAK